MFEKKSVLRLVKIYQDRLQVKRILKILGITQSQYQKMLASS